MQVERVTVIQVFFNISIIWKCSILLVQDVLCSGLLGFSTICVETPAEMLW